MAVKPAVGTLPYNDNHKRVRGVGMIDPKAISWNALERVLRSVRLNSLIAITPWRRAIHIRP